MANTTTLLKNDGRFVYSDYTGDKAGRRLIELATDLAQVITRTYGESVQAVLVSKANYDTLMAAAIPDPILTQIFTDVSDDFLGGNLSEMVDLIQSRAQTPALVTKVADLGSTAAALRTFQIYNSKGFYEGEKVEALPFSGDLAEKGVILGCLIHPALYTYLTT